MREIPDHITRPNGAKELTAAHRTLDIASWKMVTGRELMFVGGVRVHLGDENPKAAVINCKRQSDKHMILWAHVMFRVTLKPGVKANAPAVAEPPPVVRLIRRR